MTMTMSMSIRNCFTDDYEYDYDYGYSYDYVYVYVYVYISYIKNGDGPYNFYTCIHSIVLFFFTYSDLPSKYTTLEKALKCL